MGQTYGLDVFRNSYYLLIKDGDLKPHQNLSKFYQGIFEKCVCVSEVLNSWTEKFCCP